MTKLTILLLATMVLQACAGNSIGSGLPEGAQAYNVIPLASADRPPEDYRIGALDALDITVLQEPELSTKMTQVDVSCRPFRFSECSNLFDRRWVVMNNHAATLSSATRPSHPIAGASRPVAAARSPSAALRERLNGIRRTTKRASA